MAQSKKKKRKSTKPAKQTSPQTEKSPDTSSRPNVSEERPAPLQRGFWWWFVLAALLYCVVTVVTCRVKDYDRYEMGVVVLERYKGQTTFVGWPIRWLAFQRETTESNENATYRFAWAKVSAIALLLNVLSVVAAVICFRQTSAVVRTEKNRVGRILVIIFCLGYLLNMPFLAAGDYIGKLPGGVVEG